MKIINVSETTQPNVYQVTFYPNWLEKLFSKKQYDIFVRRRDGWEYTYGGGGVYYHRDGTEVGNGSAIQKAIDQFRNSWQ